MLLWCAAGPVRTHTTDSPTCCRSRQVVMSVLFWILSMLDRAVPERIRHAKNFSHRETYDDHEPGSKPATVSESSGTDNRDNSLWSCYFLLHNHFCAMYLNHSTSK